MNTLTAFLESFIGLVKDAFLSLYSKKGRSMLLDRIPTRVPGGVQEFNTWSQSLIDTYGFPDNDSVRFMFAAMIMHLGQTEAYKSKRFFALSGLAAASKEIARDRMVELKETYEARAKAETSKPQVVVDSSASGQA